MNERLDFLTSLYAVVLSGANGLSRMSVKLLTLSCIINFSVIHSLVVFSDCDEESWD